jgi:hypothetical protein
MVKTFPKFQRTWQNVGSSLLDDNFVVGRPGKMTSLSGNLHPLEKPG